MPALLPDVQAQGKLCEPPAHQTPNRRATALSQVWKTRLLVVRGVQDTQEKVQCLTLIEKRAMLQ